MNYLNCNFLVFIFLLCAAIIEFRVIAANINKTEVPNNKTSVEDALELDCSPREVWKSCGTACPATCDNMHIPDRVCTEQCIPGCFCKDDYVRNSNGYCVEREACHQNCSGQNEIWTSCGSACPLTCGNYSKPATICPAMCVQGCFCADDLVWNNDGDCVPSADCSLHECPVNEVWQESGPVFSPTCSDPYPTPSKEHVSGCFCKTGYVRGSDGCCIHPKSCQCNDDEDFILNGTGCPKTCKNLNPAPCPKPRRTGCFCKSGLVRNTEGACVTPQTCEHKCGTNQVYRTGRQCGNTCATRHADCSDSVEEEGCFCANGTFRNEYDFCVHPFMCEVEPVFDLQELLNSTDSSRRNRTTK